MKLIEFLAKVPIYDAVKFINEKTNDELYNVADNNGKLNYKQLPTELLDMEVVAIHGCKQALATIVVLK